MKSIKPQHRDGLQRAGDAGQHVPSGAVTDACSGRRGPLATSPAMRRAKPCGGDSRRHGGRQPRAGSAALSADVAPGKASVIARASSACASSSPSASSVASAPTRKSSPEGVSPGPSPISPLTSDSWHFEPRDPRSPEWLACKRFRRRIGHEAPCQHRARSRSVRAGAGQGGQAGGRHELHSGRA